MVATAPVYLNALEGRGVETLAHGGGPVRLAQQPRAGEKVMAELSSDRMARVYVWKPIEYELKARDRTSGAIKALLNLTPKIAHRILPGGYERDMAVEAVNAGDMLRVKPGDRLLDIGCGWGALIVRAAKKYGARATGITLSKNQLEYTRARIRAEGR